MRGTVSTPSHTCAFACTGYIPPATPRPTQVRARMCWRLLGPLLPQVRPSAAHVVLEDAFKLLHHHRRQQQPYAECHQPTGAAAGNVQDALPPAAASSTPGVSTPGVHAAPATAGSCCSPYTTDTCHLLLPAPPPSSDPCGALCPPPGLLAACRLAGWRACPHSRVVCTLVI